MNHHSHTTDDGEPSESNVLSVSGGCDLSQAEAADEFDDVTCGTEVNFGALDTVAELVSWWQTSWASSAERVVSLRPPSGARRPGSRGR